jgi:hypothetical protein
MKLRNPVWCCPRIAQQIALAFGIPIDKDLALRNVKFAFFDSALLFNVDDSRISMAA